MKLIDFAKEVGKLKSVKRSGWLLHGIKNPESVAEHTFRVAVLAMVLAPKFGLDSEKVLKMALLDDLAEGIVGDLVVERGHTPGKRNHQHTLEKKALRKIFSLVDDGQKFISLWEELQAKKTQEARLVKQVERLEMAIQALEYESKNKNQNLQEFFDNAEMHIKDKELVGFFEELKAMRNSKAKI